MEQRMCFFVIAMVIRLLISPRRDGFCWSYTKRRRGTIGRGSYSMSRGMWGGAHDNGWGIRLVACWFSACEIFGNREKTGRYCDPNCAKAFVHRRQPAFVVVERTRLQGGGKRTSVDREREWTKRHRWGTGSDREGERAFVKALAGSAPCQWQGTRVRLSSGALANIKLARMRSLQGGPIGKSSEKRATALSRCSVETFVIGVGKREQAWDLDAR